MIKKNHSISARIKSSLLLLSLGLSLIFALLTFLLLYVIEDQVFINQLLAEQKHYQQLSPSLTSRWQPANRHMLWYEKQHQLPMKLQKIVKSKHGIYEFFEKDEAYFILHGKKQDKSYFITFKVSELLAVKKGRYNVMMTIVGATLIVMILSMMVSIRLSKNILSPLRKLITQIQENGFDDLNKDFSAPFAGDEVGILTKQLEVAIGHAQSALQREFEFNSGVSHELRTPIQVALNSVELIELTQLDSTQDQTLKRLKRSIAQMEQISEAFLWLASSRSLDKTFCQPSEIIKSLKTNYQHQFPKQKLIFKSDLTLHYPLPKSVLTVILDNLLRNAFQHGHGDIHLNCSKDTVEVINKKSVNHSNTKGYGIGLMIVKRICKRLGWKLVLNDKQLNQFNIQLKINQL